jgi:hypothetical protein
LQTARGISIIAMQLSSAADAAVLDFHADKSSLNVSAVKNKAIASNPERSANALILMRLLYIKVAFLSSEPCRPQRLKMTVLCPKWPFTICSHIYIFHAECHAFGFA